jgi:hypothetical protein
LHEKLLLLDFDSQAEQYFHTLQKLKELGVEGDPFTELERYQAEALKDSDYFGDKLVGFLHFGCGVIQSEESELKILHHLGERVRKGEQVWVVVGIFIHWVLVRAHLIEGRVCL